MECIYAFLRGVSIPFLGLAFSMLMVGKLSDLYGRRTMFLLCLTVCLLGAIWCALSSTFVMLIIARTALCIGQGGLAPLASRRWAICSNLSNAAGGSAFLTYPPEALPSLGPVVGGWFVDNLSWRYIFWCGVPLLVMCLVMVLFGLSGKTQHRASRIDGRGGLLAAAA